MPHKLGTLDLDKLVARGKADASQIEGRVQLTMISGVHPDNNQEIGIFTNSQIAQLVAVFLLELDGRDSPEYKGYSIAKIA